MTWKLMIRWLSAFALISASVPCLAQEAYEQALGEVLQERKGGSSGGISKGEPLVAFEARSLKGESITHQDFAGKVLVIDFWGTWCPPCIASLPHLRKIHAKSEKDPIELLSISNDSDEGVLRDFVADNDMDWPQIWDSDRELTRKIFKISRYPTLMVVGHDGVVRYRQSGWGSEVERQLDSQIAKAIRAAKKAAKKR